MTRRKCAQQLDYVTITKQEIKMKKLFITLAMATAMATGTHAQEAVQALKVLSDDEVAVKLQGLVEQIQEAQREATKAQIMKFANENPNGAGVYAVRTFMKEVMSPQEIAEYVEGNEFFKTDETIKQALSNWTKQAKTAEGEMFVDFSAEYEGKTTKLSDYVGRGKYVLVDFWASWCGPCRGEIPNLIEVNKRYGGERFMVIGVASNDRPEDTKKAMEQLGVDYPQIMNAGSAGLEAYGITGIPQIILFAPDGKILKRNLRGAAIEQAVAEALK